ncbi:SDR family oxidoreductase [Cohaesibacter intestini]|uniref:SDR family oxidoreductase n=1 Tax=Cohaesibacter intestini TaxID=2211145 RepID=UPI000DEAAD53|nr:SDR family oxidoreductase [Cohaesibacter intestini]
MKHCIITGSNRGIGLELTRAYLDRPDWHIHACCRAPEKADDLRQLVTNHLGRVTLHKADVTDQASLDAMAGRLEGQAIDLLINNAGIMGGDRQSIDDMDYDAWSHVFAVNSMAPMRVVQSLLPNLKAAARETDGAKIVTISSQLGALSYQSKGRYAYRSSKAAVNMVMKLMAADLKPENIACILFHPGWVQTDMGGVEADITPQDSARQMADVIDRLTLEDTGSFLNWTGDPHDW